jgi:outer membrane murein-binding lipoprotein Lpp
MKSLIRIATPVMAIALLAGVPSFAHAQQSQNTTAAQDWNAPPPGTEQAQQGYRDGVQAAQLDRAARRTIDAKASHLYVHPPVKGAARDEYRSSFEAGYQAAVKHAQSTM